MDKTQLAKTGLLVAFLAALFLCFHGLGKETQKQDVAITFDFENGAQGWLLRFVEGKTCEIGVAEKRLEKPLYVTWQHANFYVYRQLNLTSHINRDVTISYNNITNGLDLYVFSSDWTPLIKVDPAGTVFHANEANVILALIPATPYELQDDTAHTDLVDDITITAA